MTPNEAETRETDTRNLAYEQVMKDAKPSQFAIGDSVRVLKKKSVFGKGYETRYSIDQFTIDKIESKNYILSNGKSYRDHQLQKVLPKKDQVPVFVEGKASEIEANEKKPAPTKDVAAAAKFEHRTDQILKHKEGVAQSNITRQLRERKPESQLVHSIYGRINW